MLQNIVEYSILAGIFTPFITFYQLQKLYPFINNVNKRQVFVLCARNAPVQTVLKACQMISVVPVVENIHALPAFGIIGILQGLVYGQSTVFFSKNLGIHTTFSYKKALSRGIVFAASRDIISQGVPFTLSPVVKHKLVSDYQWSDRNARIMSVLGLSILSTYLSHVFHNAQLLLQTNAAITNRNVFPTMYSKMGSKMFFSGVGGRVVLLLGFNVLNDIYLK
jgi:hypothetical protein